MCPLGLAIVRGIVEIHKGQVTVESRMEESTTFETASTADQQGYSRKSKSDHQDWDQAVDGITALRDAVRRPGE